MASCLISKAIASGEPAYNTGKKALCASIYAESASRLLIDHRNELAPGVADDLSATLEEWHERSAHIHLTQRFQQAFEQQDAYAFGKAWKNQQYDASIKPASSFSKAWKKVAYDLLLILLGYIPLYSILVSAVPWSFPLITRICSNKFASRTEIYGDFASMTLAPAQPTAFSLGCEYISMAVGFLVNMLLVFTYFGLWRTYLPYTIAASAWACAFALLYTYSSVQIINFGAKSPQHLEVHRKLLLAFGITLGRNNGDTSIWSFILASTLPGIAAYCVASWFLGKQLSMECTGMQLVNCHVVDHQLNFTSLVPEVVGNVLGIYAVVKAIGHFLVECDPNVLVPEVATE